MVGAELVEGSKKYFMLRSLAATHEHDFARHASLLEQLLSLPRFGNGKSLRDQGLNLLLVKEVEQSDQVLSKECRPQPFEGLYAVGNYPFPAWKKPATGDVQRVNGNSM